MLARVRNLNMIYVYDINRSLADKLVADLQPGIKAALVAVDDPSQAISESDIIVTCTPSKKPLFNAGEVREGTFIAAVGTDSDLKQELDPSLFKSSKVITDITEQAATIGDLHHAIEKNIVTRDDVFAELGEIVCGTKKLKVSDKDIVIFDSTGIALQDVATSSIVFTKASASNAGLRMNFAE
jgi:ornithine cyclodeaminase/alanine dehydrogenase